MASACMIIRRQISTSCSCYGKRNFRNIYLGNKRGSRDFKREQATNPNHDIPIDTRGVKPTGRMINGEWINIPEMIPELIVPSLKDFDLKPYVSYKCQNVGQREFTARDLFQFVYAKKIKEDFKNQQLHPDGSPMYPSKEESLTPEEAKREAQRTGADMFTAEVVKS